MTRTWGKQEYTSILKQTPSLRTPTSTMGTAQQRPSGEWARLETPGAIFCPARPGSRGLHPEIMGELNYFYGNRRVWVSMEMTTVITTAAPRPRDRTACAAGLPCQVRRVRPRPVVRVATSDAGILTRRFFGKSEARQGPVTDNISPTWWSSRIIVYCSIVLDCKAVLSNHRRIKILHFKMRPSPCAGLSSRPPQPGILGWQCTPTDQSRISREQPSSPCHHPRQ